MKRLLVIMLISLSLLAKGDGSIDDYQLIWKSNIFDRTRGPKKAGKKKKAKKTATAPVVPRDAIYLSGIVVWDGEAKGIFSSTTSEFAGTFGAGEEIAGIPIKELSTSQATVMLNEAEVIWPVGVSLQRKDEEPWELSEAAPPPAAAKQVSSSKTTAQATSTGATDMSREAILKRLMERRKKELKK